jgi:hypothetical protein
MILVWCGYLKIKCLYHYKGIIVFLGGIICISVGTYACYETFE